jgi:hypothetical protein
VINDVKVDNRRYMDDFGNETMDRDIQQHYMTQDLVEDFLPDDPTIQRKYQIPGGTSSQKSRPVSMFCLGRQ